MESVHDLSSQDLSQDDHLHCCPQPSARNHQCQMGGSRPLSERPINRNQNCAFMSGKVDSTTNGHRKQQQKLTSPFNDTRRTKPVAVVKPWLIRPSQVQLPVRPRPQRPQQLAMPNQSPINGNHRSNPIRLAQMPPTRTSAYVNRSRQFYGIDDVDDDVDFDISGSIEPGETSLQTHQGRLEMDYMLDCLTLGERGPRRSISENSLELDTFSLPPIVNQIHRSDRARLEGINDRNHSDESTSFLPAREFYREIYKDTSYLLSPRERRRVTSSGAIDQSTGANSLSRFHHHQGHWSSSSSIRDNNTVLPSSFLQVNDNNFCRCSGVIGTCRTCPLRFDEHGKLILLTL